MPFYRREFDSFSDWIITEVREQACRQAWRALALVIKAKLEAVAANITTFNDEFLANIVLPDGRITGQWMRPQIEAVLDHREMPKMLPDYSATARAEGKA